MQAVYVMNVFHAFDKCFCLFILDHLCGSKSNVMGYGDKNCHLVDEYDVHGHCDLLVLVQYFHGHCSYVGSYLGWGLSGCLAF